MKCENCGKEIEDDSLFCEFCGAKIEHKRKQKKKLLIPLVCCIICLFIVGIIIYKNDPPYCEYTYNNHNYVDLGLNVMWATSNVGALINTAPGGLYSWGELEIKYSYTWDTYKFGTGNDMNQRVKKYSSYGYQDGEPSKVDGKFELDNEDDAANSKWGGEWRIPSDSDFDELMHFCKWKWTTLKDGTRGFKITSKIKGYRNQYIFLPASGVQEGTQLEELNICGFYWSKTLKVDYPLCAKSLKFFSNYYEHWESYRSYGLAIRPVFSRSTATLK